MNGYDTLFVDLDGVVYRGRNAVPHAVDVLSTFGGRVLFVTNNASRTPKTVAAQLNGYGLSVTAADVVTSAQAAAAHLVTLVPPGARILVTGGDGLVEAVTEQGLRVVTSADEADAVANSIRICQPPLNSLSGRSKSPFLNPSPLSIFSICSRGLPPRCWSNCSWRSAIRCSKRS